MSDHSPITKEIITVLFVLLFQDFRPNTFIFTNSFIILRKIGIQQMFELFQLGQIAYSESVSSIKKKISIYTYTLRSRPAYMYRIKIAVAKKEPVASVPLIQQP